MQRLAITLVVSGILLVFLFNLNAILRIRTDLKDMQQQSNQNITLMNTLRSNSQHLREVCNLIANPAATAPEGWFPFESWYAERVGL